MRTQVALAPLAAALVVLAGPPAAAQSLPAMVLTDMAGRQWTERDLRGRVTLIDFWATWCAPCLEELPHLKRLRAAYPRQEFEILGVSFDTTDRRSFVSWINRQGVAWPQIFDRRGRQGEAARLFGIAAVPSTILVDAEGRIVARNLRGERLRKAVDVAVAAARLRNDRSHDVSARQRTRAHLGRESEM